MSHYSYDKEEYRELQRQITKENWKKEFVKELGVERNLKLFRAIQKFIAVIELSIKTIKK